MEVLFRNKALEELYKYGKTKDKTYSKLPDDVIKRYCKVINYLRPIQKIDNLYAIKSLHYEKKHGSLKGFEAVWITRQYRLIFTSSIENNGIVTSALIIEISKHYE